MIFRDLDENDDWTFGAGIQNMTRENQAIGLNIKTRLLSWVGDRFFDQKAGIDWVNRLGSKDQRVLLELDLRRIVLQSESVTGINSFDTVLEGRNFVANYSVNTIFSKEYIDSLTVEIEMPDIIDADGLTVKTAPEINAELVQGFKDIYGEDINVDQNSPDGQIIGIMTQMAVDLRELAVQINNGFNPNRAVGRILDERVVINNIERTGGTYTITDVRLTVDRTVELQGLDAQFNDINGTGFTVQDNAGNQFILIDSDTLTAGVHDVSFRARQIGRVETTIGTIVNPVTVVIGVTAINNPSAPTTVGQQEETDAQLRVRRQQSVALASNGYLNGMLGAILDLDGVTDARLYENYTNVEDENGIPPHATWLIVEGGSNADIGNVYYEKKSYGSNMKGEVEFPIVTPSGGLFIALFDRPVAQDLYIKFDIQRTVPLYVFDEEAIKEFMVDNLVYKIGDFAETSSVTTAAILGIASQGGGGVPINVQISDDGIAYVDFLEVENLEDKWTLSDARIDITVI